MFAGLLLRKPILLLVFFLAVPVLAACGSGGGTTEAPAASESSPAEAEKTLTVFAAASLTDAFGEIATEFDAANPGVTTAFNFAGSNQLATQINGGAPADVFASANRTQMDAAVEFGRIEPDAPVIFATNRLVVVIPADNPGNIQSLQDLATPDTLVVLAAEAVPVGQYSLDFLDLAAADPAFGESYTDDVLTNVASYEENVRSVLNKVLLGEADAGIVYTSDLVGVEGVSSLSIPDELNSIAEYPISALNDSVHEDTAAAFVDYVLSEAGQEILANYGFGPAPTR